MRVTFAYRHPTPAHCDVAVFLDGAMTGTLRLRQDELPAFRRIVAAGCDVPGNGFFVETGVSHPGDRRFGDPLDRDYFTVRTQP
jgi:hypothetical protein